MFFRAVRLGVLRDAEVENFDQAVGADHHIFRFDVAMNYPRVMGRGKRAGYLNSNLQPRGKRKFATAQARAQRDAVNKFRRDEVLSFEITDLVDGENVWVVKRRGGECFLSETPDSLFLSSAIVGK